MHEETIKTKKQWQELWFSMSELDTVRYNNLKALDIFEFWNIYDVWKASMIEKQKQIEKLQNENKRKPQ